MSDGAPFAGIKVVDLTRALAGPYCTMMLADLGAEVIKIEPPGRGDDSRAWGPPFVGGESAYFMSVNRNKKSVSIDLKSSKGKEILQRLVKDADVLVENFRPGTAESLGAGYAALVKVNPRLIYCSISGFGQTGPRRNLPGYDIVTLALSGMMSITGEEGRPPMKMGVPVSDIGAGMFAAFAISSALFNRLRSKRGEHIDVSLFEGQLSWLTHQAASFFATGRVPGKMGSAHSQIAPYQAYRGRDEFFIVGVGNDDQWRALCSVLPHPELAGDLRFRTNASRVKNRVALDNALRSVFSTRSAAHWVRLATSAGVPASRINDIAEALSDPQSISRGMVMETTHPKAGRIKQIGIPYRFVGHHFAIRAAPPLLGQHTDKVLRALGYTPVEIKKLRSSRVIQ